MALISFSVCSNLFAQNVSINSDGSLPDNSAMLDVSSTTKGLLLPRMTTTQQNSIALPANGLSIFNTTLNTIMINTGTPASPVWSGLFSGTIDTASISNFSVKVRSLFSSAAPITYSSGSIGITQAGASTNGYLSSTDWNTFNNKGNGTVTNVTANAPMSITGTSTITPKVVADTSKSAGRLATFTDVALKQNQLNGTGFVKASGTTISYDNSTYLTSIDTSNIPNFYLKVRSLFSATAPITYGNGLIGITQATSTTAGYLSSADWNTFNNKASAASSWSTTGNSGTSYLTNFLGTTDNKSLYFRTNNVEGMILDSVGNVGISITGAPSSNLDVDGSIGSAITTTTTNLTLNANNYTVVVTGLTPTITLPAATGCPRRIYIIVNETGNNLNLNGTYVGFNAGNSTIVSPTSSITIQSNGTKWYRIQ
jgi:hypothetical protein